MELRSLGEVFGKIKNKKITFSRAGHEPALIIRKQNLKNSTYSVEELHGGGMAVGMVPSSIFDDMIEDVETEFDSEDTLLLFTDGVSEATNQDGEEYGLQIITHIGK